MAFMFLLAIAFIVFRFLSKLMEVNSRSQRQTGQVPQNLPQNTRNEPLIGSEAHHNDNGAIRRAQGTATTSNRQVDYSTQVPSNSSNNNYPSADRAQQLAADEELARRLQRQEVLEARREEHEQEEGPVPFRYNLGFFNPSTRSGMRDSQSFDHDDIEIFSRQSELLCRKNHIRSISF
jgi:hypothetical protein